MLLSLVRVVYLHVTTFWEILFYPENPYFLMVLRKNYNEILPIQNLEDPLRLIIVNFKNACPKAHSFSFHNFHLK